MVCTCSRHGRRIFIHDSVLAVLLQAGYLIIKGVWGQDVGTVYELGLPIGEVSAGFNRWLANAYR